MHSLIFINDVILCDHNVSICVDSHMIMKLAFDTTAYISGKNNSTNKDSVQWNDTFSQTLMEE